MRSSLFYMGVAGLVLVLPGGANHHLPLPLKTEKRAQPQLTIGCAPSIVENTGHADHEGKYIIPLPGTGHYQFRISSSNDSARFYFNQGLSFYYSYHSRESVASFREAARLDSGSAISYWGEALAMGPSYNGWEYEMPSRVTDVLTAMNLHAVKASAKEKSLIRIMNERYSTDPAKQRENLNSAYAIGLLHLINRYPADPDIKALYVDAVMLQHPWDFWFNDGMPKSWTMPLVNYCEQILKSHPHHPGAMHYYIHLTEASRHPEKAIVYARQLQVQLPGVAHMVHMASHVYERTGNYKEGVSVNDLADEDLNLYDSLARNLSLSTRISHYYAVQSFCALSGAMFKRGMPKAFRCRSSVTPSHQDLHSQYLYMFPVLAWVRMGKWEEILKMDPVPEDWVYARQIADFAKGLAFLRIGHPDSARKCLTDLQSLLPDSLLQLRNRQFNRPAQGAQIAGDILSGELAFSEKAFDQALLFYKEAVQAEDRLIYIEPKDWMIPARQFLGTRLMNLKRLDEAIRVFKEDLIWNPGNGWSNLGLYQCLCAKGMLASAAHYKRKYLQAFGAADVLPEFPVY